MFEKIALPAAVLAATAALTTPTGAAPAAAAPSSATPATVQVVGHGFGHGRGMSQYGAKAAAAAGNRYTRILSFYYPKTATGSFHGRIRVHVDDPSANTTMTVRAAAGLRVRDRGTKTTTMLPDGPSMWRVSLSRKSGRPVLSARTAAGTWKSWRPGVWRGPLQLNRAGKVLKLLDATGVRSYRGSLRAVRWAAGDVDVVNVVPIDTYLAGVVPAEMPASWPTEALKAQAVAARTYAAAYAARSRAAGRAWDICDTTACQVYSGVGHEHRAATRAVAATRGQIRTWDGRPINAEFSASNGGYTSAGPLPYQRAKPDPWDAAASNPYRRWSTTVLSSRLSGLWPAVGRGAVAVVAATDQAGPGEGRATRVRVTGAHGSVLVDAGTFQYRLGLRSTYFTLTARAGS